MSKGLGDFAFLGSSGTKKAPQELEEKEKDRIHTLCGIGFVSFGSLLNIILFCKDLSGEHDHTFYLYILALSLNVTLLFIVLISSISYFYPNNEDQIDEKEIKADSNILSLSIGADLIELANPEKNGQLIPNIGLLRQSLYEKLGYKLPPVRTTDNLANEPNEYKIIIRGNVITSSKIYPDSYLILKSDWDKTFSSVLPPEFIESLEPVSKERAYWLKANYVEKLIENESWNYPCLTALQVIIYHLREIVIENIDKLFAKADLRKILDQVKCTDSILVNNILNVLPVESLRKILINLIRAKISIKDIYYILENLEDLAAETTDPELLAEKLKLLLKIAV